MEAIKCKVGADCVKHRWPSKAILLTIAIMFVVATCNVSKSVICSAADRSLSGAPEVTSVAGRGESQSQTGSESESKSKSQNNNSNNNNNNNTDSSNRNVASNEPIVGERARLMSRSDWVPMSTTLHLNKRTRLSRSMSLQMQTTASAAAATTTSHRPRFEMGPNDRLSESGAQLVVGSRWQTEVFLPCRIYGLDEDQTVG